MKTIIIFIMSILFLSSCAASESNRNDEKSTINDFTDDSLKSVEVNLFRSDSTKAQPELINVYFERSDIVYFLDWFKGADNRKTSIPSRINSIFIYSFHYAKSEEIETQKRLAYVTDINNNVYIHELTDEMFRSLSDFETFKEGDQELIVNIIGNENWYTVKQIDLNISP